MRRTALLGVLLASSTAAAGTVSAPILGGTPATEGQFPSVVVMEVGGGLCTGTLIAPEWVLTAAHCIQGLAQTSVKVHFRTVDVFRNPGVVIQSAALYPKPGFSQSNLGQYDIGLVKLQRPVTDITPLPVNLYPDKAPVGIKVTMVGYGATAVGGGGDIGTAYVVEQTSVACPSFFGTDVNLLCFSQSSGKGKCQGDSGGPSFAMIDGRMTQVGVTSFGDQNCSQYGADTRTDVEKPFLLQYVPQLECTTDADCPMGRMCFMKKCIAQPFTDTGLGDACTGNAECDSGACAMAGDEAYCSMNCTPGSPETCPSGFDCIATGANGACWPIQEDPGCCDASGHNAGSMLFGIALFGVVMRRKRRR